MSYKYNLTYFVYFSADADESTGLRAALSAAQITVNCFSASSFVLEHTHGALSLASQDLTGIYIYIYRYI